MRFYYIWFPFLGFLQYFLKVQNEREDEIEEIEAAAEVFILFEMRFHIWFSFPFLGFLQYVLKVQNEGEDEMEEAEAALEAGAAKVFMLLSFFIWLLTCVSDKMRFQISNLS